jgi:GTP pyrophosphokinase
VPGDEIVGFVTRGRGVTIHRTDCINVLNFPESERERLIEAEWEGIEAGTTYGAEINIFAGNRTGLIVDISRILTEANIEIKMMNSRVNKKGIATITMGFDIHGKEELNRIIEKLRNVEGVTDIVRTAG